MRHLLLFSLFVLLFSCEKEQELPENIHITWGLHKNNFDSQPRGTQAYFLIENPTNDTLNGDWEIRFSGFMSGVQQVADGYEIAHLDGEYYALRPTAKHPGIPPNSIDSIPYQRSSTTLKMVMAPKGFFLLQNGELATIDWEQLPMSAEATFNDIANTQVKRYNDPAYLYERYPEKMAISHGIVPTPNELSLLADDQLLLLTKYQSQLKSGKPLAQDSGNGVDVNRIHLWFSGVYWHEPMQVFKGWLDKFYGIELVIHPEEKPKGPHLELIYERTVPKEAYEIFNMSQDLTVVSASDPAGMLYGLATIMQSLRPIDGYMALPLQQVNDAPRFAYRGQHLDVGRNFQSKESIFRLLDLMALFKLNKFHFHLTEDEGWRLEIPDLPELTSVGATRGYTTDESDHLHPAYGSGSSPKDPYGSGYYSKEDFIEILKYAHERQIEVIPEIDLPGHARAAIKAMQAYEKRTGDSSYRLHDPEDKSQYRSIQSYPDNVINVCQNSTYNFLRKVVSEIGKMYYEADLLPFKTLHTGGDEVPAGVWTASPECLGLLKENGIDASSDEAVKNALSTVFLQRFNDILNEEGIRVAGWEEIGMKKELMADNQYAWKVNPELSDQNFLAYVWNSLGGNLDLGYRLANAGYDVVLCNVTNLYFDLAYSTDPAEGGFYWGGFVDTYKPWAFAPFDVVKTVPAPWYAAEGPTEATLRANSTTLTDTAHKHILGIQGQLWTETVRGPKQQEHYLWPKMLGLAERAWSAAADWETIEVAMSRKESMQADWQLFANRLGQYTLPLLDQYSLDPVNYRLPPPAAIIENGALKVKTAFPGLPVYYQQGNNQPQLYKESLTINLEKGPIKLQAASSDGKRRSVVVEVE